MVVFVSEFFQPSRKTAAAKRWPTLDDDACRLACRMRVNDVNYLIFCRKEQANNRPRFGILIRWDVSPSMP